MKPSSQQLLRCAGALLAAMAGGGFSWASTAPATWPQWLGPNRDGVSVETGAANLLRQPQQLWKASIGAGCSSLAIGNGRAYTMGHITRPGGRGTDVVYCLDAQTGAIRWQHSYECATCVSQDVQFDGPRSTPTLDGKALFTLSLEGNLFCLEATSGAIIWSRFLTKDFGGRAPVYGCCCSPLLYGNLVLLELNAPDASYIALNKSDGAVAWKYSGGQVTCGSPVLTRVDGVDWAVFAGGGAVVAIEPGSGRELWRHRTWGHAWMGPVVWSNLVFMANASLPRGCGLIKVDHLQPKVVWEDRRKFQTLHCNSVIWNGHLYGADNSGTDYQGADSKKSSLKCLELDTGAVKWTKDKTGWANLIVFDGYLVILRETGELIVAEARPDAFHEFTRAQVLAGPTWTAPALAEGRLYCRNRLGEVGCLALTGSAVPPGSSPVAATAARTTDTASRPPALAAPGSRPSGQIQARRPARSELLWHWPRFRGVGGLGVSGVTNAPLSWNGRTGEGVLWKSAVPLPGPGSPVVWGKRLFLAGADRHGQEVFCYEADTGQLSWRTTVGKAAQIPARGDNRNLLLAASTPVTDGQALYVIFGAGDIACFDFAGREVWARNLGAPDNAYGHASSLELWDNRLIVQLDQGKAEESKSRLLSLDCQSGDILWQTCRATPASWSSPLLAMGAEGPAIITCAGPYVLANEPDTGKELWRVECLGGEVVPSPIQAAGLILAGAVDGRFAAIRPDGRGNVTATHVVWSVEDDVPAICSPVSNEELVFLVNSGGLLLCYEVATGRKLWEKDLGAHFQASPTIAGDYLFLLEESGEMSALKVGRQYEFVSRSSLGEPCAASPAFQPGRIYLRGSAHVYCLGNR